MGNRRVEYIAGFGVVAVSLAAACILSVSSQRAHATPAYASQTGLACGRCHVNPAGGGPNTSFGKAFAANGHKLPKKGGQKTAKTATGTEPDVAPAPGCGYYSSICNPRFGHVPEIDYSSGLSFMIFPKSD